MALHIVWKKIRGKYGPYAYLYESYRDPATKMPRQRYIRYLGLIPLGTKIAHVKQKTHRGVRKTRTRGKGHRRQRIRGRRPKACMLSITKKCRHPRCIKWACEYYQPTTKKRRKKE